MHGKSLTCLETLNTRDEGAAAAAAAASAPLSAHPDEGNHAGSQGMEGRGGARGGATVLYASLKLITGRLTCKRVDARKHTRLLQQTLQITRDMNSHFDTQT